MTPDERTEHEIVRAAVSGAMTPDEAAAEQVLDAWEAHPDWRPDSNRHVLVDLIAAALQAERGRCLGALATLVARYSAEHDAIPVDDVMDLLADLRLLAAPCATAR